MALRYTVYGSFHVQRFSRCIKGREKREERREKREERREKREARLLPNPRQCERNTYIAEIDAKKNTVRFEVYIHTLVPRMHNSWLESMLRTSARRLWLTVSINMLAEQLQKTSFWVLGMHMIHLD